MWSLNATQNAQAFAALTAIQNGDWDRYLRVLHTAIMMRTTKIRQES